MSAVFKIARRNLRKNWRHSLASIMAIATACMSICVFQGFYLDASTVAWNVFSRPGMLGHIIIQARGAPEHFKSDPLKFSLSRSDQAFVDDFLNSENEQIDARVRWLNLSGMVSNGRTNTVFVGYGFDLEQGARIRGSDWSWNALYGKPLASDGDPSGVAIGLGLGAILDCEPATDEPIWLPSGAPIPRERPFKCFRDGVQLQTTTGSAHLNALDVRVVGLVDAGLRELEDLFMIMPLEIAQQLVDTDKISMYTIRLKDPAQIDGFLSRLNTAARGKGIELEAGRWDEHRTMGEFYRRSVDQVALLRVVMMVVLALIGSMSVVNTVGKNVAERTREIGTLRSIGYLRRDIATMFAAEGLLLALVACVVGVAAASFISMVVSVAGQFYPPGIATFPLPLHIPMVPVAYVVVTFGLCVLSTVAALLPALRAARMKISDALGHL